MTRTHGIVRLAAMAGLAMGASLAPVALAQMLLQHTDPPAVDQNGAPDPSAGLRAVSLIIVEPPKPRDFNVHDKVTIIIAESSKQSASQKLDTKKDAAFGASLKKFPDLMKLLEAELTSEDGGEIVGTDVSHSSKFKGEGTYTRDDRFTDRVTATIIDVKPNGVLVIEAKRTIKRDEEEQVVSLSGECRREDVTESNTVLSTQLAELTLISKNSGQVKDSATKGLIPRLFEFLFNF